MAKRSTRKAAFEAPARALSYVGGFIIVTPLDANGKTAKQLEPTLNMATITEVNEAIANAINDVLPENWKVMIEEDVANNLKSSEATDENHRVCFSAPDGCDYETGKPKRPSKQTRTLDVNIEDFLAEPTTPTKATNAAKVTVVESVEEESDDAEWDLNAMSVKELRELADEYEISPKGTKKTLIARLESELYEEVDA